MISTGELHKQYPNCIYMSLQCLHCPKTNCNTLKLDHRNDYKFSWLKTITCTLCQETWFVCESCTINRRFRKHSQLISHNKNYHNKGKEKLKRKTLTKKMDNNNPNVSISEQSKLTYNSDETNIGGFCFHSMSDDNDVCGNKNDKYDSFVSYYNSLFKSTQTKQDYGIPTKVEFPGSKLMFNNSENMNLFRYWLVQRQAKWLHQL